MSLSLVINGLQVLAFLTIVAFLVRVRIPAWWNWGLAGAALLALAAFAYEGFPGGIDIQRFHNAGRAVWKGDDPYARGPALLNPPTALPLFALLALAPFVVSLALWDVLNVVGYAAVVPFTQAAIREPHDTDSWELAPPGLALLAAAVAVCSTTRTAIAVGQLSLATFVALLAALWCQRRNRPVGAGLFLAVASIKVHTMMPFLLLFLRKRDWLTWATMIVAALVLSLASGPADLPARLRGCLTSIQAASERLGMLPPPGAGSRGWLDPIPAGGEPGRGNDSSFDSGGTTELISFDCAVYHLGVRDRGPVRVVGLALVVLLGTWVGWEVLRPPALGRAARCALVAAYAAVFLYHRGYDMVVLVIPLVYAAGRAVTVAGGVRWVYRASALACLLVLDLRMSVLGRLTDYVRMEGTGSRLLEAVVLPYGIWLVVALMAMLVAAERYAREQPKGSYRPLPLD
jgi:hypothetical protein